MQKAADALGEKLKSGLSSLQEAGLGEDDVQAPLDGFTARATDLLDTAVSLMSIVPDVVERLDGGAGEGEGGEEAEKELEPKEEAEGEARAGARIEGGWRGRGRGAAARVRGRRRGGRGGEARRRLGHALPAHPGVTSPGTAR